MPKVRRTLYNLGFKLKVVADPEDVENNSEIARDYGIVGLIGPSLEKRSGEPIQRRAKNVGQTQDVGSPHCKVSSAG